MLCLLLDSFFLYGKCCWNFFLSVHHTLLVADAVPEYFINLCDWMVASCNSQTKLRIFCLESEYKMLYFLCRITNEGHQAENIFSPTFFTQLNTIFVDINI